MKRRDFLKAGAAGAASVTIPLDVFALNERALTREMLRSMMAPMAEHAIEQPYHAFLHPATWKRIREFEHRTYWKHAWRRYRLARREGVCGYLSAHDVWDRFHPPVHPAFAHGEIGRYVGIRIHITP